MKKIIVAAVVACAAAFANAAAIGWTAAGMTNYKGDAYSLMVIGQNGVTSIDQITALLDAGSSIDTYAFGSGTVATSNGAINQGATASGKTLDAGTYTGFYVLFDSATPVSGESKYCVISGQPNMTISFESTAASKSFGAANVGTFVNNASNWHSFGSAGPVAPEPTSGLLLLLGMAGLALKRKHA